MNFHEHSTTKSIKINFEKNFHRSRCKCTSR